MFGKYLSSVKEKTKSSYQTLWERKWSHVSNTIHVFFPPNCVKQTCTTVIKYTKKAYILMRLGVMHVQYECMSASLYVYIQRPVVEVGCLLLSHYTLFLKCTHWAYHLQTDYSGLPANFRGPLFSTFWHKDCHCDQLFLWMPNKDFTYTEPSSPAPKTFINL